MYNVRAPDTGVTLRYLSECVCVCARVCVIVRYSVCVKCHGQQRGVALRGVCFSTVQ
jgi:hypothetical protein